MNLARTDDAVLRLFFTVYPDPSISSPAGVEIEFMQQGNTLQKVPLPLPAPDSQGRIPYVMTIPASAIPPGEYEVKVVAKQADTSADSKIKVTIAGT